MIAPDGGDAMTSQTIAPSQGRAEHDSIPEIALGWHRAGKGAALASRSSPTAARVPAVILLGKKPGAMALTRIPRWPHSPARARVKLTTAPLLVL